MSDHPINILFRAKDQATKTIRGVNKELTLFGRASKGANTAARNLGRIGAVGLGVGAAAGIVAIRSGLESLAERENVITATENAIRATGKAATVSAGEVRAWSEAIETATGAAVDDKAIQSGANTLIRFRVESKRALAAAVDLGAGMKTGPEQGAKILGKALADPVKGMTALRRAGVVLTAQEEKHIKALVKQGHLHKAQAALLSAVEARYKGAAAASAGPYTRSLNMLEDASEDAKMALAEGFLPVIERFAGKLQAAVSDPKTMQSLRDIGTGLANAADEAITFVTGLPWDKIGAGLGKAADFAKGLVGAFTSMPPEVQATIIALAGMDRLSGGAVSGIVGELGKGLVKGVLGINAGVVNVRGAVVNGGGGGIPGGAGAGAGAAGGAAGLLGTAAAGASIVGGMLLAKEALLTWVPAAIGTKGGGDEAGAFRGAYGGTKGGQTVASFTESQMGALLANAQTVARNTSPGQTTKDGNDSKAHSLKIQQAVDKSRTDTVTETNAVRRGVEATKKAQDAGVIAFRAGERTSATGLSTVATTTRAGTSMMAAVQSSSASRIVGAVQAAGRPTVNVYVSVPGAKVNYGSSSGSAGRGSTTPRPGDGGIGGP